MASSQKSESSSGVSDNCPKDIAELIIALRDMEIQLGHLPPHTSNHIRPLEALVNSLDKGHLAVNDETTEKLFEQIVRKLRDQGFSPRESVDFINARLRYEGSPPYCDESEVEEAL